ncbi:MAG: tRNA pseudouridine(38-40) synthase TruA [Culicoidibacterales bacterium]
MKQETQQRLKCLVAYDGSDFSGYQRQPKDRTVQGEIELAISRIMKQPVVVHASGRTDAGVHAHGQVFHFDTHLTIPEERWVKAINKLLPPDIYIRNVEVVPADDRQFHARFSAVAKEYRYRIKTLPPHEYNPCERRYVTYVYHSLDVEVMREAVKIFIGTHDFRTFAANPQGHDCVRTITNIEIKEDQNGIEFIFNGNGFLRYMVRSLVGTILEVGRHRLTLEHVSELLNACERRQCRWTAPAQGLTLWEVSYEESNF